MEEPAPVEGQGQLPSPHQGSLRKAVAAALALDGESTLGRRKKKKKESRPESIIIYRSENEKLGEEPEEPEGRDPRKEEEGDDFLDYPADDGKSLWGHLLKAMGRKPSEDPPGDRHLLTDLFFLVDTFLLTMLQSSFSKWGVFIERLLCSPLGDMEEITVLLEFLV